MRALSALLTTCAALIIVVVCCRKRVEFSLLAAWANFVTLGDTGVACTVAHWKKVIGG